MLDSAGDADWGRGTSAGPSRGGDEGRQSDGGLHPAAAQLIAEVRASGEFTEETWRRLSEAMDDLSDTDLSAVLEEIGRMAGGEARLAES